MSNSNCATEECYTAEYDESKMICNEQFCTMNMYNKWQAKFAPFGNYIIHITGYKAILIIGWRPFRKNKKSQNITKYSL